MCSTRLNFGSAFAAFGKKKSPQWACLRPLPSSASRQEPELMERQ